MNLSNIFFISFSIFISCTEIGVIEENIPFEKKYIVNGRLKAGSQNTTISFTESFSLENDPIKDSVSLNNITSYIWSEDDGIFPLVHEGGGNYVPRDEFEIGHGARYELHAKIGKDRIYASTNIPQEPNILEVQLVANQLSCKILSHTNTVYGCKYIIRSHKSTILNKIENTFFEISEKSTTGQSLIEISTSELPQEFLDDIENYTLSLDVYAFDMDYREYYYSRLNNKPVENVFSEGGGSVFWNVQGNDAIGMFIGYSVKEILNINLN